VARWGESTLPGGPSPTNCISVPLHPAGLSLLVSSRLKSNFYLCSRTTFWEHKLLDVSVALLLFLQASVGWGPAVLQEGGLRSPCGGGYFLLSICRIECVPPLIDFIKGHHPSRLIFPGSFMKRC